MLDTGRAILWLHGDKDVPAEEIAPQDAKIEHLAFGHGSAHVLAVLTARDQTKTLCLCADGWTLSNLFRSRNHTCEALVPTMACRPVDLPGAWQGGALGSVHASPSGRFFVIGGAEARLGLLKVQNWPWQRPTVRTVAPRQTRPINAPFAFNETENALAVPNGDTGIRIIDPSDLSVLTVLPTPSRVYALTFDGANLISTDGANEDAIFRVQPWAPKDRAPAKMQRPNRSWD